MLKAHEILAGVVRTLTDSVLPALAPGQARAQLFASVELLENLEGRICWGGTADDAEADALAALFETVSTQCSALDHADAPAFAAQARDLLATRAEAEDFLDAGRSCACALIDSGLADSGTAPAVALAVDAYLLTDAATRAMLIRPSRLAEISQG